jgi:hypothetical protein
MYIPVLIMAWENIHVNSAYFSAFKAASWFVITSNTSRNVLFGNGHTSVQDA